MNWMSLSAAADKWGVIGLVGEEQHGVVATGTAVKGARTHVAGVWDGTQLRLFVNGKEYFERLEVVQQPKEIKAGKQGSAGVGGVRGAQVFLAGKIHGIRVSKTARYRRDFEPSERFENDDSTIALYKFDEGQGDKLTDSSGNSHDGKIVGAKWVKLSQGPAGNP